MPQLTILSPSQQVAIHLRGELLRGVWSGMMPGVPLLAADLQVDRKTIDAALRLLEEEGLLVPQGVGKRRQILLSDRQNRTSLRVAILVEEAADRRRDYMGEIQDKLAQMGHSTFFVDPTSVESGMELRRIERLVKRVKADAWVVYAGSRELLEWFSARPVPTFALFGRRRGLPMAGAGPDKPAAYAAAVRALIALGHRRIVLLTRTRRRLPEPGASERAFLGELAAHGLPVSDYNLPGWDETIPGFHARLKSLFQFTPPTALIVDEVAFFAATQQFLARRQLRVPEDVSLVSTDADPSLDWCQPSISHMRWESGPVVQRLLRWAANVSQGKQDFQQTIAPAEFVTGGTIGPAAGRRTGGDAVVG